MKKDSKENINAKGTKMKLNFYSVRQEETLSTNEDILNNKEKSNIHATRLVPLK